MDELQALYDVYMQNGILGQGTTFEQFSSANDVQLESLYNQGLSARLLSQQTDLDTFKSAWAVKKKDGTDSVSEVGISEQQETVEDPTPAEQQPQQEGSSFGSDLIKSWNQGRAQAQSIDDVLNIVRQGREVSDTELDNYVKAVQKMQTIEPTEGMQQFQKEYEEGGKDVGSFIFALGKNLDVVPEVIASSIASMIAPDVAYGALGGAATGAATGAGLTAVGGPLAVFGAGAGAMGGAVAGGTAVLEGTLSFTEFLQEEIAEQGLDFTPEGIRAVLENEEAISNIKNRALKRGVAIGLVEALSFGLANKVGGKLARGLGKGAIAKSALAQAGIEGAGGAVGESLGRAVAGQEQDVAEIGLEFFAEVPGAGFSAAPTLFKRPKYTQKGETGVVNRMTKEELINFVQNSTAEDLLKTNIQVVNDQETSDLIEAKMVEAQTKVNLKKAYPNLSEENLNKLVPLQKRLTDLKSIPVDTEEVEKSVKEEINNIVNAVQKPSSEEISVQEQPETSTTIREGDTEGEAVAGEVTPENQIDETAEPSQEVEIEAEVSETEVISKPIDDKFVAKIKQNKVLEIIDNEGNPVDNTTARRLEKKIIDQGLISLAETDTDLTNVPSDQATETIIETSNSPREIATTIELLQDNKGLAQDIETAFDVGLPSMFNSPGFSPESVKGILGVNSLQKEVSKSFVRTWIRKKGRNINDGYKDDNNVVYDKDEIIEFITNYPTRNDYISQFGNDSQLLADAKIKFTELTGLKATPANIKQVAAARSIQQLETDAFLEAQQKEGAKSRDVIEKKIQEGIESRTPPRRTLKKKVKTKEDIRQDKIEKKQIIELSGIIRKIKKRLF